MSERDEVVVIGAGVTGLAIGGELARRGHRVRLLEAGDADAGGATAGNAGMVVPSHFVPLAAPGVAALGLRWLLKRSSPLGLALRPSPSLISFCWRFLRSATEGNVERSAELLRDLHLRSRAHFLSLAESAGTSEGFDLAARGIVVACRTAEGFEEERRTAARARELGIPAQPLAGEALRELDPALATGLAGGVHYPLDAHLSPDLFLAFLRRRLLAAGGAIEAGSLVLRIRAERGGRVHIETPHGSLLPATLVLAAGVEAGRLAAGLGVSLPLEPGKGYSLTDPAPPASPALPALLHEDRVAVTPMGGRLRVAGTLELGAWGTAINRRRVAGILAALPRFYRGLDVERLAAQPVWSGLRPCTPDGLPYFGPLSRFPNVWVASGAGMMGLSLAPVTGELLADWIEGEPGFLPTPWRALLAPERFGRS